MAAGRGFGAGGSEGSSDDGIGDGVPISLLVGLIGAISGSLLLVCLAGWLITGRPAFAWGALLFTAGVGVYGLFLRKMARGG